MDLIDINTLKALSDERERQRKLYHADKRITQQFIARVNEACQDDTAIYWRKAELNSIEKHEQEYLELKGFKVVKTGGINWSGVEIYW